MASLTETESLSASLGEVTIVTGSDHAELDNLDYASSGHTGFASSAQLTAEATARAAADTALSTAVAGKQDTLTAGTGIEISGATISATPELFLCTRETTYAEVTAALAASKLPVMKYASGTLIWVLVYTRTMSSMHYFASVNHFGGSYYVTCASTGWSSVKTDERFNKTVLTDTTQNITGVKTFLSSPIVPTPTTDMQAATKKYVDDAIAAAIAAL